MEIILYKAENIATEPQKVEPPVVFTEPIFASTEAVFAPMPEATIINPSILEPTEISVTISTTSRPFVHVLKNLGIGIIIGSALLFLYAISPILIQEISYRLSLNKTVETTVVDSPYKPMFEVADIQKQQQVAEEAQKWGVDTNFSIVIPKISAASKIIPNVNAADEKAYVDALKQGVGHADGTSFPGNGGTIYLFSHSTNSLLNVARFNAVFYLVKELVPGDEIIIFYTGRKFVYKVSETLITAANDTKWLGNQGGEEQLILQTCWPPGTSTKRLIVVAKPA